MGWEDYVNMLNDFTVASAVISNEGALCAKSDGFIGTQNDFVQWSKIFKDPPLARQHGVSYGDKKLFALEYTDDFLFARCDEFCVFMKKSRTVFVVGCSDGVKLLEDTKREVLRVSKILFDAGA